mmetsp:Transcript_33899/g.72235  ORF Transcript_33899/g.72235 Transcript_33899/m.72235 type:complete len:290 (+) Transcript_33899:162-1031(+)
MMEVPFATQGAGSMLQCADGARSWLRSSILAWGLPPKGGNHQAHHLDNLMYFYVSMLPPQRVLSVDDPEFEAVVDSETAEELRPHMALEPFVKSHKGDSPVFVKRRWRFAAGAPTRSRSVMAERESDCISPTRLLFFGVGGMSCAFLAAARAANRCAFDGAFSTTIFCHSPWSVNRAEIKSLSSSASTTVREDLFSRKTTQVWRSSLLFWMCTTNFELGDEQTPFWAISSRVPGLTARCRPLCVRKWTTSPSLISQLFPFLLPAGQKTNSCQVPLSHHWARTVEPNTSK